MRKHESAMAHLHHHFSPLAEQKSNKQAICWRRLLRSPAEGSLSVNDLMCREGNGRRGDLIWDRHEDLGHFQEAEKLKYKNTECKACLRQRDCGLEPSLESTG